MLAQMKKNALATTCAFAVLAASSLSAHAANTVEVQVKGSLKPPSCTPLLGGGAVGTFDHGNIDPAKVTPTDFYIDPTVRELPLTITCDGVTAASITTESQRKNTVGGASVAENAFGVATSPSGIILLSSSAAMGLGTVAGNPTSKIGGYSMAVKTGATTYQIVAGGALLNATGISRNAKGVGTWASNNAASLIAVGATQREVSWASSATSTVPVPFLVLNTVIQEQAYLNKSGSGADGTLDKSKQVDLDGDAIITVNYL